MGIDLVRIADVAASIDRFGSRYLRRVFTELELSQCDSTTPSGVASLAARFAGKEAALKVLGPDGPRPGWRTMEIERQASGACLLHLRDSAAVLAAAAGITGQSISLTHEGEYAAAVVYALCASGGRGQERPGSDRWSPPVSGTTGPVGLLVTEG